MVTATWKKARRWSSPSPKAPRACRPLTSSSCKAKRRQPQNPVACAAGFFVSRRAAAFPLRVQSCYHVDARPTQIEKILVADEDPEVLDLVAQQVLKPMGYQVAVAQDGNKALQIAKDRKSVVEGKRVE